MQDTPNMLTRWAIDSPNFDFTIKIFPSKLVVVDAVSRICSEVNGEEVPSEPRLG